MTPEKNACTQTNSENTRCTRNIGYGKMGPGLRSYGRFMARMAKAPEEGTT